MNAAPRVTITQRPDGFLPQAREDLRALRFWYNRLRRDNKDDTLLLGLIAEFERDGLRFGSVLDYCSTTNVHYEIDCPAAGYTCGTDKDRGLVDCLSEGNFDVSCTAPGSDCSGET